jgi:hypothetical protein
MRRLQGLGQAALRRGAGDQVDVVGHQAICPDLNAGLAHLLAQQIAVDSLVAILEDDRVTSVPPRAAT